MLASRISYVGELGWELYVPMEQGAALWRMLHEAGGRHGAVPVGIGVYATTGRLEKSYRAFGFELDGERSIVEAGMQRPKVKAADFTGREAYLKQREQDPARVMCTLAVDDHTSASGVKRYMLGGEPILAADGSPLTDGHGHHPYVTSAGSAPSLGKHLLMAYLPPGEAAVGTRLAVSYMEELYPVTVVSADATAAFDPDNERVRMRMTRVLVAVKRVVDSSGEAVLTDDQQGLDGRYAGYTIGDHDACAVELGIQVAEATGGSATIVSVGVAEAVEQIRGALALGAHAGVLVEADPVALGPADVAAEIAAVVTAADAAGEPYDLVLLGNDAADTGDFQVPVRLAYAVGRPIVTGARHRRGPRRHPGRDRVGCLRRRDLRGAAAGRGVGARGRHRAALPDPQGPDGREEDRGRRPARHRRVPAAVGRVRLAPAGAAAHLQRGDRRGSGGGARGRRPPPEAGGAAVILVMCEVDPGTGEVVEFSLESLALARSLSQAGGGVAVRAVVVGEVADRGGRRRPTLGPPRRRRGPPRDGRRRRRLRRRGVGRRGAVGPGRDRLGRLPGRRHPARHGGHRPPRGAARRADGRQRRLVRRALAAHRAPAGRGRWRRSRRCG